MRYTLSDIFEGNFPISQLYGARPWYYSKFGLRGHEGVDWATPVGIRLLCPFSKGIVIRTGWDGAYGYYVVIWDPIQKCAVWYCHMSRIHVTPGQQLLRGAIVGLTGASGNVSGPHLHCNFVTTDIYGNRLDRDNGYQGFKNILSQNLVIWQLK